MDKQNALIKVHKNGNFGIKAIHISNPQVN